MKRILWAVALLLIVAGVPGVAKGQDTEGDLTVDLHWLDAIQAADHATMSVSEHYFFNNSGSEPFAGNFYFELPAGAEVSSRGISDMVCQLREFSALHCFYLETVSTDVVRGSPFNDSVLSYYGQKEPLTLRANSTLGDESRLHLNATVGYNPVGTIVTLPASPGLHLTMNDTELGGPSPSINGIPTTLTYTGGFTVHNNRSENATVELSAAFTSGEWMVRILDSGVPVTDSFPLDANATRSFTVEVEAPNHLAQILVEYVVRMPSTSDREWQLSIDYLYHVLNAEYFIFVLDGDNTTGSATGAGSFGLIHENPTWQEEMDRWWFFFIGRDIAAGGSVDIQVVSEVDDLTLTFLVAGLVIVGAAVLVALALLLRRRRIREEDEAAETLEEQVPAPAAPAAAASADTARYEKALARLEKDHTAGRIPNETYERMKGDYEKKIDAAKTVESPEVTELRSKKAQVLEAIKELRAEHDAGSIDMETFQELEAGYRQEAVAIMKRLDELQAG
jgi:hypothetical protein